jgi:peptidoglycan/LPS O-acetylase OafA/YrhL
VIGVAPDARTRLSAVTGLRFLAALHVYFGHAMDPSGLGGVFLYNSRSSVSLFFVLSGFILAYVYADGATPIDRRRFWIARFARIYPVYVLSIAIALPVWLAEVRARGESIAFYVVPTIVAVLALAQSWNWSIANAINGPAWSLSVEAFCYAVFPAIVERVRRLDPRRLALLALGTYGAVLVLNTILDVTNLPRAQRTDIVMMISRLIGPASNPARRSLEFIIGAAVGCLFLRRRDEGKLRRGWRWDVAAFAGLVAIIAELAVMPPKLLTHNGLLAPLFAIVIVACAVGGPATNTMLGNRASVFLGEASYAVYLLHLPILWYYAWAARRFGWPTGVAHGQWVWPLLVTLVISALVHIGYERPLRRRINALAVTP